MCPPLSLCRIWIAFLFVGSEKAFDVVVSAIRGRARQYAAAASLRRHCGGNGIIQAVEHSMAVLCYYIYIVV